jgi:hypothetical protein
MNVIMNVCADKDKINKKSSNCHQTFKFFVFFVSIMFSWLLTENWQLSGEGLPSVAQ